MHSALSPLRVSIDNNNSKCNRREREKTKTYIVRQVAQLSQRNRAAAWVSFGWVVDDGVGQ